MSIIIFSRQIRSGKTTELLNWCSNQENVSGILMPDINGKRKFLDIKNQIYFDAECTDPSDAHQALIQVGRFFFYKPAFEKANAILLKALVQKPSWIVIDEIGKLEIENMGLYFSVKKIITSYYSNAWPFKLLIVMRKDIKAAAISHFHIKDHMLIHDLQNLPG